MASSLITHSSVVESTLNEARPLRATTRQNAGSLAQSHRLNQLLGSIWGMASAGLLSAGLLLTETHSPGNLWPALLALLAFAYLSVLDSAETGRELLGLVLSALSGFALALASVQLPSLIAAGLLWNLAVPVVAWRTHSLSDSRHFGAGSYWLVLNLVLLVSWALLG